MTEEPLELNDLREAWTEDCILFWKPPSPFSQWTLAPFDVEGVTYGCAEQYMMAEKARLFDDGDTLAEILANPDPAAQRALGRSVTPYDGARWDEVRLEVVVRGNLAKFTQIPAMRDHLLRSGSRLLVEASPRDRVWGIGLGPRNPRATDPSNWRGRNLLGQALMRVRETIDPASKRGGA